MKVLLISEYFPPKIFGGGEISASLLAKSLAKEGIDVSVLTSHFSGLKDFETVDGVKIYRRLLTGRNPSSFTENLKRAFIFPITTKNAIELMGKEDDYQIMHCMNATSVIGAAKLKGKIKKPFVAHVNSLSLFCPLGTCICGKKCSFPDFISCFLAHGKVSKVEMRWYLRYNPLFSLYVYSRFTQRKNALKKMDFFIAISSFMKELLLKEGIPKERIAVVPNPIEPGKFINTKGTEHKIPRILFLGSYEKFKGPQILLEALGKLKDEKFEADFYGSGSLKGELESIAKKFRLAEEVRINDEVPYALIPRIYASHDIVVFPSLWPEPFGRVLIEGMASGKVVIASKIGGISGIIEDEKTGFLFSAGDVDELAKTLRKVLSNPKLAKNVGTKAKESATKYSGEKIATKLVNIYEKINKLRRVHKLS